MEKQVAEKPDFEGDGQAAVDAFMNFIVQVPAAREVAAYDREWNKR